MSLKGDIVMKKNKLLTIACLCSIACAFTLVSVNTVKNTKLKQEAIRTNEQISAKHELNKQIKEKIDEMDLEKTYRINSKVESFLKNEVEYKVQEHLNNGRWSELNVESRQEIRNIISSHIKETVEPHVKEIFDKIPKEELDNIILDILPKVLVDLISDSMKSVLMNYFTTSSESIIEQAAHRIRSIY